MSLKARPSCSAYSVFIARNISSHCMVSPEKEVPSSGAIEDQPCFGDLRPNGIDDLRAFLPRVEVSDVTVTHCLVEESQE